MASAETERVLERFVTALTGLEAAIDRRAPVAEIAALDAEVADSTREALALVERQRSRRIG